MRKSMNSGTFASVAPPERSSRGMMWSTRSLTVGHSCAVKKAGAAGAPNSSSRATARVARSRCAGATPIEAARGARPSTFSASRRFISDILECSFLHLARDVVRRAPGEREDRPRRILVRLRHEWRAVGDEQVLTVVRLAVRVHDRRLRIVAHARAAELVDDLAASRDVVALLLRRHRREDLAAHLRNQRTEGLVHVLHLVEFVVRPTPAEARHRNAPAVYNVRIDLHVRAVVRNHFPPA